MLFQAILLVAYWVFWYITKSLAIGRASKTWFLDSQEKEIHSSEASNDRLLILGLQTPLSSLGRQGMLLIQN